MSPPAKRKRTEETAITRSKFWFSDGGVVLQVENTQFRVHWGVLAHHSSVFRDMQELPQPSDEPNIDGCPVVKLPDNAVDVEYLLEALYEGPTFLAQKTLPLAAIGAFIRLGRKYDFKNVLNFAMARIIAEHPTTLEKYDAMGPIFETIEMYYGIYFDVITLLSENAILTALPLAYYRATHMRSLDELFDKIIKADGSRASLSEADLRTCAVGHQKLFDTQFEPGYTLGWARDLEVAHCTSLATCRSSREKLLKRYKKYYLVWALRVVGSGLFQSHKLCAACARCARESMIAGRKKIWEELPGVFGLPPWNELKNDL
ncbi:hypothetical protein C8R45DRAFT_851697 [Mycena sanguinolenta]|nr:hypothetical protein C8R45DRAFT_851697 [Mycena sanguinolenta]